VSWKVSSIAAILSTSGSCARFALNCPSRGGSKLQPSGLHASARARQDTRTATDTHGRMNGRAPALAAHMPTCVHAKRTSLLMFTEDAIPITLNRSTSPHRWAVVKFRGGHGQTNGTCPVSARARRQSARVCALRNEAWYSCRLVARAGDKERQTARSARQNTKFQ
jgi:hypothetical protein